MHDDLLDRLRARAWHVDASRRTDSWPPETPFQCASRQTVRDAEASLGFALPGPLVRIYTEVANGGFGPGGGIFGVDGGHTNEHGATLLELHHEFADRSDPNWRWPERVLPICTWGDAIFSCVDCGSPEAAIVTANHTALLPGQPMSSVLARTHTSLELWLEDWLNGVKIWDLMFEDDLENPRTMTNPFTRVKTTIYPVKVRRWV